MMSCAAWQPYITGLGTLFGSIVVPWAIMAYQKRTGVAVTDQERAAVMQAINTAVGLIQTKLDQGHMSIQHIDPRDPLIMHEAQAALDRVPMATEAQGVSVEAAAVMIAARVDTRDKDALIAQKTTPAPGTTTTTRTPP